MSRSQPGPRFIFHGNAMPFGARILKIGEKDTMELVDGAPAGALTVVGGRSFATSNGSSFQDIFRWGATVADCKGELRAGGHNVTTITSSLADFEAVNAPFKFEAARLSNTVVSDHVFPDIQPSITPQEIVFEGVQFEGKKIAFEPNLEEDLKTLPTFQAFEEKYQSHEGFFQKYQGCLKRLLGLARQGEPLPRNTAGLVQFSVVNRFFLDGKEVPGNVLSVQGFGNVHFGEVLMNENNRRFTLVRLEMGCRVQAVAACAESDPNGSYGP